MLPSEFYREKITSQASDAFHEYIKSQYPFVSTFKIGQRHFSKDIYAYTIGEGKPCIFVAVHHAAESITFSLLALFADVLCQKRESLTAVLSFRKIIIIPMLNPDGVDIKEGIAKPICNYDENIDFSLWQSNAKGVDLNHNYPSGFDEYKKTEESKGILPGLGKYSGDSPLSEPETYALYHYISSLKQLPRIILSLHTQGQEIFAGTHPAGNLLSGGGILSRLSGYKLSIPSGSAAYGGLCDYTNSLGIPSYTIECGKGKNPLPQSDALYIYKQIEPMLFGSITLF